MEKLSAYILTRNSQQYLAQILDKLSLVADEIYVVDSGSSDQTEAIARQYELVKFVYHAFSDFKTQRDFAAACCSHKMVLFLDSDEIPDEALLANLLLHKKQGFEAEAYDVARRWQVLGKWVHCMYPIVSPDFPIRLYNKEKVSFRDSSLVHETPAGYSTKSRLLGSIQHYTFENQAVLNQKLELYSDIAAKDLILKKKKINRFKSLLNPFSAFFKWYFLKGGFKDGKTGWILGCYAYRYTRKKYLKAQKMDKSQ